MAGMTAGVFGVEREKSNMWRKDMNLAEPNYRRSLFVQIRAV